MTTNKTKINELRDFNAIAFHLGLESYGPKAIQLPTYQDIGNAIFTRPDNTQNGILDTHGSIANRLETMTWDDTIDKPIACLQKMPFVTVNTKSNKLLTTSLHEPHRLNSPYIFKSEFPDHETFEKTFGKRLKATDGDRVKMAKLFAEVDPMSLIHGTFMSYSKEFEVRGGGAKITAALSGFAEATNIQAVEYGTQKSDRINAKQEEKKTSKEGFGTFQTSATLWSPESIDAYFHLDIDLLRSYQLGENFVGWAIAISLLKILRFIDRGLRLRSHCILQPKLTESGEIDLAFRLPLKARGNYFELGFPDEKALATIVTDLTERLVESTTFGEAIVLADAVTNKK
ncbi:MULTISPECIES: type I-U CRISPR-associated RAMP protein Csb1/Cas7u [Spirulina sp. CCY15215]|uniref:type I-G CRISPR-associated RAMP protein Csb1/Cas7g n=1 Tax=Spirulina sp. CCY15215 TaxID=2767591 RepID=UPI001950B7EE|nr:type I-U CRISPR-associated RAMP protein Csb1/Cas7u [Spirulina major]